MKSKCFQEFHQMFKTAIHSKANKHVAFILNTYIRYLKLQMLEKTAWSLWLWWASFNLSIKSSQSKSLLLLIIKFLHMASRLSRIWQLTWQCHLWHLFKRLEWKIKFTIVAHLSTKNTFKNRQNFDKKGRIHLSSNHNTDVA